MLCDLGHLRTVQSQIENDADKGVVPGGGKDM